MNTAIKAGTGIAAILPASVLLFGLFGPLDWWAPSLVATALAWVAVIGFAVFALKSPLVPKEKRILWAALIVFGNMVVLPVFWFVYVLSAPTAPQTAHPEP